MVWGTRLKPGWVRFPTPYMVHHMAGASLGGVLDCHLVPMHWGPHSGVATCKAKKGVDCLSMLSSLYVEFSPQGYVWFLRSFSGLKDRKYQFFNPLIGVNI